MKFYLFTVLEWVLKLFINNKKIEEVRKEALIEKRELINEVIKLKKKTNLLSVKKRYQKA